MFTKLSRRTVKREQSEKWQQWSATSVQNSSRPIGLSFTWKKFTIRRRKLTLCNATFVWKSLPSHRTLKLTSEENTRRQRRDPSFVSVVERAWRQRADSSFIFWFATRMKSHSRAWSAVNPMVWSIISGFMSKLLMLECLRSLFLYEV